jgi:PhoPQ-activated pathogenicity-related protein
MPAQVRHQRAVWGDVSPALHDYTERGVLDALLTAPDFRALLDPYEYRAALALPKFTVLATNDSIYPCDSLPLYWEDLPGPKFVLYLANQDHELGEHASLPGSLCAFHELARSGAALPRLSARRRIGRGALELTLESSERPREVRLWTARSASRDLRDSPWTMSTLAGDGRSFTASLRPPAQGFQAHFAEAVYTRSGSPLHLASSLVVVDAGGRIVSPGHEREESLA